MKLADLCNPFRVNSSLSIDTQGARRSAATLGFVVQRLRRKSQETMWLPAYLEFVCVSIFELIRGYRFAQPPANGCDPFGINHFLTN